MEAKDINFAAMPQTAVQVVSAPAEFFKSMPKTGGFVEPLVFAAIMGAVAGVIYAIAGILGLGYMSAGVMGSLKMIILTPIFTVIGSFIGAAIMFVIWKLMGSQENYETAYRCTAYLMALAPIVAVLGLIPYVGIIIYMAIWVYYIVIASVQVHNLPSQKAWLVFGIIGLLFMLWGLWGVYSARNMASTAEQWRKAGEETTKAMEKSSEEMRKQAEEMAKQFQKQADEARKQAERNR